MKRLLIFSSIQLDFVGVGVANTSIGFTKIISIK